MDTGQSHSQGWRLVTCLIFMQFSSFMRTQFRSQRKLVLIKIADFFFFSVGSTSWESFLTFLSVNSFI